MRNLILYLMAMTAVAACVSRPCTGSGTKVRDWTVMCYFNGDSDLGAEALQAVDAMESVGSGEAVDVLVLVDGHPAHTDPFGDRWRTASLLHVGRDATAWRIGSPAIERPRELDMGLPETLEGFIRFCRSRFPARRYLLVVFSHGRGIIDYRRLTPCDGNCPGPINKDETNGSAMTPEEMSGAVRNGMGGARVDLTVLFSCLSGMVEVGYAMTDATRYLISSQDEIHLVKDAMGQNRLRGMRLELLIDFLRRHPTAPIATVSRFLIDDTMETYRRGILLSDPSGRLSRFYYPATLAAMDTDAYPALARGLDHLAALLTSLGDPRDKDLEERSRFLAAMKETKRFRSFLDLEYYDLVGLVTALERSTRNPDVANACQEILRTIENRLILHRGSVNRAGSSGLSIFLSHPLIPRNVYEAHQSAYRASRFGRETSWDEMIDRVVRLR